jgi:DNA-binding transcriptional MerR regulator/catechol 2,3-dioxygenase-like lactoylglutathione lyase family enzyme
VAGEELMTIGRFARISGLSVHTLRHYDDVGLLAPAEVDPATGYRRYRRDQVRQARLIQALRWIDLPIEEIGAALFDESGDTLTGILRRHRLRLERSASLVSGQLADVDYYLERGLSMTPATASRPVQLKIAVDDVDDAIVFYQQAFGFHYDVTRRTDEGDYSSFMFSKYGERDFFLLHLLDETAVDRPGPTTFGLLVDDLDAAHERALAAGAIEVTKPQEPQGMPRTSAVKDPSGNWVWLYQG